MNVSTMYMTYKILAVVRIFGTSLFTFGPGLSARSRCMVYPLPLSPFGESARRNTSTPMPPSQWLKLRQYIIPGESASTSPKIEEPVVVNPDTISNRASTKFGISLEKTNGSVICPKELCCNTIVRYVRAMQNTTGAALTLHNIAEGQAEALEFVVDADTKHIGEPLRNIRLKRNILIACISHGSKTEIPNGDSMYEAGNSVIIVAKGGMTLLQLNDIFE